MYLPIVSLFIGLASRAFLPWLVKRWQSPNEVKWNWKYIWPQLLGFGLIVLVLPLIIADLESIANLPSQAAWIVGWGAADIGRKTAKAFGSEEL